MRINQFPGKPAAPPAGMADSLPLPSSAGRPPTVSIGMPLYNGETYLREALDCLRNQEYSDYEVIISDNASTDSTAAICRSFAQENPKVRFFAQPKNIGAVPNFNFVLEEARGTYFIWFSHDDGWTPDYLRKCVDILDRNPSVALCFSEVDFMDANGASRRHEDFYGVGYNRLDTFGKPVLERIRTLLAETNWYAIYGMYRTQVLRKTRKGIPNFGWDVQLVLEILMLGETYILPEKLMRYRIIPKTSQQQIKDITNSDAVVVATPYGGLAQGLYAFLMDYGFSAEFKREIREVFLHVFLEGNKIWRNEIFRENMGNLAALPPEAWVAFLVGLFPKADPEAPSRPPDLIIPFRSRVLWQNRNDSERLPGGDTTLIGETVKGLLALGVPADISLEDAPDLASYGLVHLNNITRTRDTLAQVRNARRLNRPIVLTPLYEDMDRYLIPSTKMDMLYQRLATTNTLVSLPEIQTVLSRFELPEHPLDNPIAHYLGIGNKANQQEILSAADCVVTSGENETRSIAEKFGNFPHMESVPYGFNRSFLRADGSAFSAKYGLKDFVLCVGRLEARKNQWSLIEIFRTLPKIKLVLIGSFSNPGMESAVKAYAPANVIFLDRLPFAELVSAFGAARVHALASWYELPGLVSLEAAAAGCRIVTTDWGTAPDYFQHRVRYCQPDNPAGIRNAILEAYDSRPDSDLPDFVAENYSWEKSARRLQDIYRGLLAKRA